mmetsp:Transcript_23757/g.23673  ORF Transcript_23757/g.23673 Transcript_23757/m.23673 type:complete len:290 (-) Transcript_23757:458-1327(-)
MNMYRRNRPRDLGVKNIKTNFRHQLHKNINNFSEDRTQIPSSPTLPSRTKPVSKVSAQNLISETGSWISKFQRMKSINHYENSDEASPLLPPTDANTALNNQVVLKKPTNRRMIIPKTVVHNNLMSSNQANRTGVLSPGQRTKRNKGFTSFSPNLRQMEARRNRKLNTIKMPVSIKKVSKLSSKEELTSNTSRSVEDSEELAKLKSEYESLHKENTKLVSENASLNSKVQKLSLFLKVKNFKDEGKNDIDALTPELHKAFEQELCSIKKSFTSEIEDLQEMLATMSEDF